MSLFGLLVVATWPNLSQLERPQWQEVRRLKAPGTQKGTEIQTLQHSLQVSRCFSLHLDPICSFYPLDFLVSPIVSKMRNELWGHYHDNQQLTRFGLVAMVEVLSCRHAPVPGNGIEKFFAPPACVPPRIKAGRWTFSTQEKHRAYERIPQVTLLMKTKALY